MAIFSINLMAINESINCSLKTGVPFSLVSGFFFVALTALVVLTRLLLEAVSSIIIVACLGEL